MGFYIGQGAGKQLKSWTPADGGIPHHADSPEELKVYPPKERPCGSGKCSRMAYWRPRNRRGRWEWHCDLYCKRCLNLRYHHNLSLEELILLWEKQKGSCYSCKTSLTHPSIETERWDVDIDHDHGIHPQKKHSCELCRRGLACHTCNTRILARRTGRTSPEKLFYGHRITYWLKFTEAGNLAEAVLRLREIADLLETVEN